MFHQCPPICQNVLGRVRAAAATRTPAMLTNVCTEREYVCEVRRAIHGAIVEHL
jgi:hypothetical protein